MGAIEWIRDLEPETSALSLEARARVRDDWRGAQEWFVDDPEGAADRAKQLVLRVMRECGYPDDAAGSKRSDAAERYRRGCEALGAPPRGTVDRTETLRQAMLDFRDVLESLLEIESSRCGHRDHAVRVSDGPPVGSRTLLLAANGVGGQERGS